MLGQVETGYLEEGSETGKEREGGREEVGAGVAEVGVGVSSPGL